MRRRRKPDPPTGHEAVRGRIYGKDEPVGSVPAVASAELASVRVHRAATDTWEDVPLTKLSRWARFLALIGW